jgi:hypothetical protein
LLCFRQELVSAFWLIQCRSRSVQLVDKNVAAIAMSGLKDARAWNGESNKQCAGIQEHMRHTRKPMPFFSMRIVLESESMHPGVRVARPVLVPILGAISVQYQMNSRVCR